MYIPPSKEISKLLLDTRMSEVGDEERGAGTRCRRVGLTADRRTRRRRRVRLPRHGERHRPRGAAHRRAGQTGDERRVVLSDGKNILREFTIVVPKLTLTCSKTDYRSCKSTET